MLLTRDGSGEEAFARCVFWCFLGFLQLNHTSALRRIQQLALIAWLLFSMRNLSFFPNKRRPSPCFVFPPEMPAPKPSEDLKTLSWVDWRWRTDGSLGISDSLESQLDEAGIFSQQAWAGIGATNFKMLGVQGNNMIFMILSRVDSCTFAHSTLKRPHPHT